MRALGQTSYYFGVPKRYMLGRLTSKGERVGKSGVFLCQATNAVTSSNSTPVWHVIFYLFDSQNPSTSIIAGIGDIPVCPSVCPSTQTFSASLPTPTTPFSRWNQLTPLLQNKQQQQQNTSLYGERLGVGLSVCLPVGLTTLDLGECT